MRRDARSAPPADLDPPVPLLGFALAWVVFWVLMTTVEVQDYLRHGGRELWRPLLWQASSLVVASAVAWVQWRRVTCTDHLLDTPWRWFAEGLKWLPAIAPAFVAVVYAIRHAAFALVGVPYVHEPWGTVFAYEMLKFGAFYLMFVTIFFGIRSHAALGAARVRLERERGLAQQARLLQLTQQLEPHFLFNALNTIASTIHRDPDLADALVTKLGALLRAATDLTRHAETSLDDEVRLLGDYGAIMVERFADRVSLAFDVAPAALACRVPTLVLQPLLENAFRHGVDEHPGPAAIVVRAHVDGGRLRLSVEDDVGVLAGAPAFGVGLANLRDRLAARYGAAASLTLAPRAGGGVIASVELPCES